MFLQIALSQSIHLGREQFSIPIEIYNLIKGIQSIRYPIEQIVFCKL